MNYQTNISGLMALFASFGLSSYVWAEFPETPPNDPFYAPAESGPQACFEQSALAQQWWLYSFIPQCTPAATDPEGAAGMSVDLAWKDYSIGRADVLIAYIEGVNWRFDQQDLANKIALNAGELPAPTTPVDDGVLNALDYADVEDANNNGVIDPEDIIVAFSDGRDDDGNGFIDDISGWDFYNRQNDPATGNAVYGHNNIALTMMGAQANNTSGGAGVCPNCMMLPLRVGADALSRPEELTAAYEYAIDRGADIIVSATGELAYSAAQLDAVERAWHAGILTIGVASDFNSVDHQGGMRWPHMIPGNAMVPNTAGVVAPAPGPKNAATITYRERSGQASWGAKNMFSVPSGEGGSGSFSGPALAGVLGLVLSWGSDAAEAGEISTPLSGPEALQLLISTASDVADPNSSWAPKAGFDLHFGYGRPNAHKALQAAAEGRIPPLAWIESPQWYSLFDPTQSDILVVEGHVSAPRSAEYEYVLEYALGAEPSEDDFIEAGRGRGSEAFEGELGRIDLSKIPEEFWGQAMRLSTTKQLETTEQYTVTLRLRVLDAAGVEGVDRRTVSVLHDPSWWPGFPMRFGQSGESQPLMVDLQGLGHLALVFGDSEGFVHAIDPMTQQELPGFPVRSLPHADHQTGHATLHEGFINNLAIADLDGHGELSIVGTSSAGRVYIWSAQGQLRPGWPKLLLSDVTRPSVPRGHTPLQRFAIDGAIAPPVLYDMNGDGRLDIIQAAWDGHLYVLDSAGNALPGWPVAVALDNPAPPPGYQFLDDRKLSAPPTLADLDGDGSPELVIRNQQAYTLGAGIQPFPRTHVFAYHADGRPVDGFPVDAQGLFLFHGGSPEFILEGLHTPAAADIDGDGDDEFSFSPGLFSPTYLMDGDGSEIRLFGPTPDALLGIANSPESLPDVINRNLASDVPVNFATTGVFGRFGAANQLSYMEPGSGGVSIAAALMLAGSGVNVSNYMRAHDPLTGAAHPGFPSKSQGLHFLAAPVIADVTGDGATEIISAADSSTLHGYDVSGAQAAGFPKYTGGWSVFAPAVGDIDGDGTVEIAGITREGVLFVWKTAGLASANNEWWGFRHDEQNTGRYGEDTRPPGVPRDVRFDAETAQLSFLAPGDNWYSGQAADYLLQLSNGEELIHTSTVAAGQREQIKLSPQVRALSLFARDTSGLRSRSVYLHDSQPGQTDDPTQSSRSSRGGVLAWNMLILLGSLLIWRQRRF